MDSFWGCNLNRYKDAIDKSSHIRELSFMLYFDHAASSPLCPEALEVLQKAMKEDFSNPSAAHKWGKELKAKTESVREDFLKRLKAPKDGRFVFTGSASESNNTVIKGLHLQPKEKIYVSLGDHASLVKPAEYVAGCGIEVLELPLNEVGIPDKSAIENLDASIKLVIVSTVNSQSGGFLDIEDFAKELKSISPGVHLHVDAVQSFGKFPLDLSSGNIDSMTVSAHKMGGPKGAAGLYLGPKVKLYPLIYGGNQEPNIRSSTIAWPMIAAFHKAYEVADANKDENLNRVTLLREKMVSGLKEIAPELES